MTTPTTPSFDLAGKLPEKTVLLEASAGTGKTYTIAHLAVRYIAERGIGIDELLVVTFTDAATMELRERIRKRIREAVDVLRGESSHDPTLANWAKSVREGERALSTNRLEQALADFDAAAISTIHGFCSRVLTQAAFESGADYSAELSKDTSRLHRDLVFDHLAAEMVRIGEAEYESLGDLYGNTKRLSNLVEEVVRNPKARLYPEDLPKLEELEAKRLESRRVFRDTMATSASKLQAELERGRAADIFKGDWKKNPALLTEAFALLETMRDDDRPLSTQSRKLLAEMTPGKLLHANKKKAWGALADDPILEALPNLIAAEEERVKVRALSFQRELLERARQELPSRKRKLGLLGFDDLLSLVASSLEPKDAPLRSHLRARFKVALIDEFQDTDPIQWTIFRAIFHEGGLPLLLIGDPKQAIYSFRGADIEVYLQARDEAHARFRLATNHRSDGPLVEAVNDIFSRFSAALGDAERLPYERVSAAHEKARLRLGDGTIAPLRIFPKALENLNRLPKTTDDAATWAAFEVFGFLESGAEIFDEKKETYRKVGPRDCAVLVSNNWRAKQVREALSALGVPSVLRTDESVFQSEEAEQLGIWLRALADPTSATRLWALMATPLFGSSAEEIDDTKKEPALLEARAKLVESWSKLFSRHGLMRALRATVLARDIEQRLAKRHGGERRLTDLWHAAELLHATAAQEGLDAEGLSLYLERERSQENASDDVRRLRLETDADAVEILTIHRSKGLEYPAVFCPDLYGEVLPRAPLRYSQDGERILDLDPDDDAKELARTEQLHERLRLAYVALTRARHLCSVAWAPPSKKSPDRRSALDWLFFGDSTPGEWQKSPDHFGHIASIYEKSRERILVSAQGFEARADGYERPAFPADELEAEPYRREEPLDTHFRWSSYSSITSGKNVEAQERGGPDEEIERDSPPVPEAGEPSGERAHLPDFKHGTQLGNLLHKVFEVIDFESAENLEDEIASRLEHFGIHTRLKEHPNLVSEIAKMVNEALRTPLFSGEDAFCLADTPKKEKLSELGFAFSIGDMEADFRGELLLEDLEAALFRYPRASFPEAYRDHFGRLRDTGLRGLMHGSIDLVFRRNHRYYVVDYKSNHLGKALSDYTGEKLEREMREKHYLLQAQIYSLALHRFLKSRLGDAYDADEHFGGVLYLFLRGMKAETGARFGVYFDKPRKEALEALDLAFRKLGDER